MASRLLWNGRGSGWGLGVVEEPATLKLEPEMLTGLFVLIVVTALTLHYFFGENPWTQGRNRATLYNKMKKYEIQR
jgi:hypothetical protein